MHTPTHKQNEPRSTPKSRVIHNPCTARHWLIRHAKVALTLTSIKARPSIGFHLFLRIFQNALLSRVILCSKKRRQAVPSKPQIIGCIITHNGEAQINASERDHSTRGSQNLKKQKTVTPTIKGNATAMRSQNTKYYILRHGLIRAPRLCDSPICKEA